MISTTLIALVSAACASGGGAAGAPHGAACPLTNRDSVYLAGGPVYRDCAVDSKAIVVSTVSRNGFQPTPGRTACYSAEVEFVVDTLGRPEASSVHLVRATDRAYGDAVVATVPDWRYQPAKIAGAAVRQIVTTKQAMRTGVMVLPAGQSPSAGARPPRSPGC